jgi:hypothetical protein
MCGGIEKGQRNKNIDVKRSARHGASSGAMLSK